MSNEKSLTDILADVDEDATFLWKAETSATDIVLPEKSIILIHCPAPLAYCFVEISGMKSMYPSYPTDPVIYFRIKITSSR